MARRFHDLGFSITATDGTQNYLAQNGIPASHIKKLQEARPNIVDAMTNKEIHLIINTPVGKLSKYDDSYIRKSAIKFKIPYITTIAAALAAARGIEAFKKGRGEVKSLQGYHADIK